MSDHVKMMASVLVVLGALLVGACETMEGAGRDVQSAGEAVEETARDVQN